MAPWNCCIDPAHHRSAATGRCLNCKAASQAIYRAKNQEVLRIKERIYNAAKRRGYHEEVIPQLRAWLLAPPLSISEGG